MFEAIGHMAISHTKCPLHRTTNNESSNLSSMSGRGFRLERKDVESGMQMFVSSARAMDSCTFYIWGNALMHILHLVACLQLLAAPEPPTKKNGVARLSYYLRAEI